MKPKQSVEWEIRALISINQVLGATACPTGHVAPNDLTQINKNRGPDATVTKDATWTDLRQPA
jgi:hypothetical protein